MVTFTAPWAVQDVPLLSPSATYLQVLGRAWARLTGGITGKQPRTWPVFREPARRGRPSRLRASWPRDRATPDQQNCGASQPEDRATCPR
jgi:hypothetical protein